MYIEWPESFLFKCTEKPLCNKEDMTSIGCGFWQSCWSSFSIVPGFLAEDPGTWKTQRKVSLHTSLLCSSISGSCLFSSCSLVPAPGMLWEQEMVGSICWYVIRWNIEMALKYLIIAAISFVLIMTIYELLIRRFNVMRFLFGMRPKRIDPPTLPRLTCWYKIEKINMSGGIPEYQEWREQVRNLQASG